MSHRKRLIYSLCIVGFTFLFSKWLAYDFSSLSLYLNSDGDEQLISDFYNAVANKRASRTLNTDIVIVGIDDCSRSEIAEVIELVSLSSPKAIGLDVIFNYPSIEGELIIEAIRSCDNIILPLNLKYDPDEEIFSEGIVSYFYDSLSSPSFGAVNLSSKGFKNRVREFRPYFQSGETQIPHFSVALAQIADSAAVDNLVSRGRKLENITYHSLDFETIESDRLIDNIESLTDKIVLIGTLKDVSDFHITPVNPQMPGVLIQAYSIATILDASYIKVTPEWIEWVIAILLCFGVVFINLIIRANDFGNMTIRIIQGLILYVIILIGCQLYIHSNIYVNFAFPIIMVGLGLFSCDIYLGIINYSKVIFRNKKKKKRNEKNN